MRASATISSTSFWVAAARARSSAARATSRVSAVARWTASSEAPGGLSLTAEGSYSLCAPAYVMAATARMATCVKVRAIRGIARLLLRPPAVAATQVGRLTALRRHDGHSGFAVYILHLCLAVLAGGSARQYLFSSVVFVCQNFSSCDRANIPQTTRNVNIRTQIFSFFSPYFLLYFFFFSLTPMAFSDDRRQKP